MTRAYIALGANLGDPLATVNAAVEALRDLPQSQMIAISSSYRTAPIGLHNQPDFINAVVAVETGLEAQSLLDELFAIEARFGRLRSVPNAPRTLDLDLLLHGDLICNDQRLTLPHPRMHERAFVLAPLAEIAPPGLFVPGHGTVTTMMLQCSNQQIEALLVGV
jgi:2-amino-4-hydroxy-6-hydroxymethyldihydropteridine diphosphokinase